MDSFRQMSFHFAGLAQGGIVRKPFYNKTDSSDEFPNALGLFCDRMEHDISDRKATLGNPQTDVNH